MRCRSAELSLTITTRGSAQIFPSMAAPIMPASFPKGEISIRA